MGNTISVKKNNKIDKKLFNNFKEQPYLENQEVQINDDDYNDHGHRLNEQDFMFTLIFEENYKNVFKKIDKLYETNNNIEVLDVGCGTGAWTSTMAKEYDDFIFTGIDKCEDFFPKDITLKNCNFKKQNIYDMNNKKYKNKYDLIMQIAMSTYLKTNEWAEFLNIYDNILKKDGYGFFIEQDLFIENGNGDTLREYSKIFENSLMDRNIDPYINNNPYKNNDYKLKKLIEERFDLIEYNYKEVKLKNDKICKDAYGLYIINSLKTMNKWLTKVLEDEFKETNIDDIIKKIIEESSSEPCIKIYYYIFKKKNIY